MMGNLCGLPKSRVPSKESVVTSFRVRWMGGLDVQARMVLLGGP